MWVGGGPVWPVFFFDTSYFIYEPLLKMYTSDGKTGLGERSFGLWLLMIQTSITIMEEYSTRKANFLRYRLPEELLEEAPT